MNTKSSMDNLFKFVVQRPPAKVPDLLIVDINLETTIQVELRKALEEEITGKFSALEKAETYRKSDNYLDNIGDLGLCIPSVCFLQRRH